MKKALVAIAILVLGWQGCVTCNHLMQKTPVSQEEAARRETIQQELKSAEEGDILVGNNELAVVVHRSSGKTVFCRWNNLGMNLDFPINTLAGRVLEVVSRKKNPERWLQKAAEYVERVAYLHPSTQPPT